MVFKHKLMAVMQHLVLACRGAVLLLRYSGYQGKGVEGLWGLPGGHYVSGHPEEDLRREVREETGLELNGKLELLRTYVVMFPDGVERYGVFYLCDLGDSPRPAVTLSHEHTAYMWADLGAASRVAFIGPYHKKIVEDVLANNISK
ncbi:MAG: NUDIX domain-containing protein [Pelotomaculum sp.]|uniref:NTP pyrophosphohydrolases n=1 Tax=Pelotomaculum thermopropionicum (strain DSM 13744 / JCM 10971 / SI) TaxID=370438 RepID=A5D3S5_PELTS|nr:NUDIX domain-containing protein [Pelotomaculum sp.]BAF59098.1 NTP pyrophosphohydrolases [Pelotomaculum thermopropionicum SI]